MTVLLDSGLIASYRDAPAGDVPGDGESARLPMLLRCTGALTDAQETVAQRFGEGVSRIVATTLPDVLMMGGGDTAYAILRSLGSRVLLPNGETEAGIPWFETTRPDGRRMRCAVKSGGFGNAQSLLKVLQNEQDG
ncbi:uncharacterized protein YgbK (DUF1537 family) [Sinorhizobium fredii]